MSGRKEFESLKKELIEENEKNYGKEIREKYGEKAVEESNRKMLNMSEEQYAYFCSLAQKIQDELEAVLESGEKPDSEAGHRIALLHKEWICMTWKTYSEQAHKSLTDMYLADERFKMHYDKKKEGCAAFLRDAVHAWL